MSVALLIGLIAGAKLNPFVAFLIAALVAGALLGLPLDKIPAAVEKGIGGTLGGLVGIIGLGAMFGKLVATSGAARVMAQSLMSAFGPKRIHWALMATGFIVGMPLFYNVGFVLLVPLVFSIHYQTRLPAVYLGIPLLAALSITHGFLPPHPSPTAMVPLFNANLGRTLLLGIVVAIPTMIIAGPLFASRLKHIVSEPLATFIPVEQPDQPTPPAWLAFATAILPVLLIAGSTLLPSGNQGAGAFPLLNFLATPLVVMLLALLVATVTLGIAQGRSMLSLADDYSSALKDVALILCIVGGAGGLKEVFVQSGVSEHLGAILKGLPLNPLLLGWSIATLIRICLGSATVAGLTAAGIMAPVVAAGGVDPSLMILAVGAGSLMCSHVNDSGFWMYKEYFNLSLRDTFMSWTLMESIIGVVGLICVLGLDGVLKGYS